MSIVRITALTLGECQLLGNNILPAAFADPGAPFSACHCHRPPYRRANLARIERRRSRRSRHAMCCYEF